MTQIGYFILLGLPIWWLAQTLLFLRDYFRQRKEALSRCPLSEAEKAELAKFTAELPRKESHPPRWYLSRPKEGAKLGGAVLLHLPFVVIFLPIAILIWILPWDHHRQ